MLRVLIHNWRLIALRGVFALLFAVFALSLHAGIASYLLRAMAFATVVVVFGLFAFAAGILTFVAGIRGRVHAHGESRWLLFDGAAACVVGLAVIMVPALTLFHLIRVIAVWALYVGVFEMVMAGKLRRHLADEWSLLISGLGSMAFGVWLLLGWVRSQETILLWLGSYCAFKAVTLLVLAFRLRKLAFALHLSVAHVAEGPNT